MAGGNQIVNHCEEIVGIQLAERVGGWQGATKS